MFSKGSENKQVLAAERILQASHTALLQTQQQTVGTPPVWQSCGSTGVGG